MVHVHNSPKKIEGGETTICDGQQLWNNLKIDTKIFLKKPHDI